MTDRVEYTRVVRSNIPRNSDYVNGNHRQDMRPPGATVATVPPLMTTGAYAELELSDRSSDFDSVARESLSVRLGPSDRPYPSGRPRHAGGPSGRAPKATIPEDLTMEMTLDEDGFDERVDEPFSRYTQKQRQNHALLDEYSQPLGKGTAMGEPVSQGYRGGGPAEKQQEGGKHGFRDEIRRYSDKDNRGQYEIRHAYQTQQVVEIRPTIPKLNIRELKYMSDGPIDFLANLAYAIFMIKPALMWIAFWIMVSIFPLSMIIMGVAFIGNCPNEPNIPTYLIVSGIFSLALFAVVIYWQFTKFKAQWSSTPTQAYNRDPTPKPESKFAHNIVKVIIIIFVGFLIVWMIAGFVWVFGGYEHASFNAEGSNYCAGGFIKYAVVMLSFQLCTLIFVSIILGVLLIYTFYYLRN